MAGFWTKAREILNENRFVKGWNRDLKAPTWKGTKEAFLIGGLVAGGMAFMAMRPRSGSKITPESEPLPPIPQILTPQDLVASAPMMQPQDIGPADGRPQDYWQQTVAAQRGGQDQNVGNPSQPRMSAIAPENVGNLGAMPVLS